MADYSILEIDIKNGTLHGISKLSKPVQEALRKLNAVYIYRNNKTKEIYIGKTSNFYVSHRTHFLGKDKVFNDAKFNQVMVIFSYLFTKKATADAENQLITYFLADKFINNDYETVINHSGGSDTSSYKFMQAITERVVDPLWEDDLFKKRHWVHTERVITLKANDLYKYSPIKTLSKDQSRIIKEIIDNPTTNYVINGDAGTGKTVILTNLISRLNRKEKKPKIGIVVQSNWEHTANDIIKVFSLNCDNVTVSTSTKLIKQNNKYDIIIVDESHNLSRKYGKQQPSFAEVYTIPGYENCDSHLEIIQKMSTQVVLLYDVLQAIRPSNVTREMFKNLTSEYTKRFLRDQFRIQDIKGKYYTSEDYVNGIKYLLYKDTGLLESGLTYFNPKFKRDVFKDKEEDAYFGYCAENPLHNLTEWLKADRVECPWHINRMIAGYAEPSKASDAKDPSIKQWNEGDVHLRWNTTKEDWINCTEDDAADQIGSITAVQGLDLNKVGVIVGSDMRPAAGKLKGYPDNFFNVNGKFTNSEMQDPENQYEFTLFVLNIYYVLLTRGVNGIRMGFWYNDAFRKYLEETMGINEEEKYPYLHKAIKYITIHIIRPIEKFIRQ